MSYYIGDGGDQVSRLGGVSPLPGSYTGPGTAGAPPPAPVAAPAPGQVTTNAGYTPDYGALIQNDPSYLASNQAATNAESLASAQRKAQLQAAVIQYGGVGANFTDAYGDIGQAMADLAERLVGEGGK